METRERGGCLTAWLVFALIVNVFSGAYYMFSSSMIQETMPNFSDGAIPVTGVIAVVNFVCMLAIWYWKKWGMYGAVLSGGTHGFYQFFCWFWRFRCFIWVYRHSHSCFPVTQRMGIYGVEASIRLDS